MEYIKHNVNMYLLFMILLSATSLVGATVFFQHKFDSMVNAYDSQIGQVNGLAEELAQKQSALQDAERALQLREAREDKLNKINEKLASAVSESQPTGANAVEPKVKQPKILSTVIGEGFTARPRRGSYAFLGV